MHESIELSFGMVSVVCHGMGVLDVVPRAARGRRGWRFFSHSL